MSTALRQMTAAALVPPVAALEATARMAALWARGMRALTAAPASPAARALPAMAPPPALLAAPAGDGAAPAPDRRPDGAAPARDALSGGEPPATIATGADRAEETGGPVQDTATLVDVATGDGGPRAAPDGAVS